ncbi:MAG: hypothetical protein K2N65_05935, partial [Anaeroplasmataceae bacterium]|nr:hypothetical protein [Anaeroplasmataceae bacterium]
MKKEFISKYNISLSDFDFENPLTVGNGDFAFTCDVTGLQSFYGDYHKIPLSTMTNHIWAKQKGEGNLPFKTYTKRSNGSPVFYMTDTKALTYDNYRDDWFKFDLFKLSFCFKSKMLDRKHISNISQTLHLYEGIIYSSFTYLNEKVLVETKIPQEHQNLQIKIHTNLKGLQVRLYFLNPSSNRFGAKLEETQDYIVEKNKIKRTNAFASYNLFFQTNMEEHGLCFNCQKESFLKISFHNDFEDDNSMQTYFDKVKCIDTLDEELNRRMVLSLYLMKVNTLGIFPPAETGLTCNSWYGKFHLEMHLWHHLGLIRLGLYEYVLPSLKWYLAFLDSSRRRAKEQGYLGARLPKMTDPRGVDTPSNIGCLLIWQMPHLLIMLDEILKQNEKAVPIKDFLPLITDLIDFMVSFYYLKDGKYHLDSPLIPANENIPETCDTPIFEECYTLYAFQIFKVWVDKYGISYDIGKIENILNNYAPLEINDGCYEAYIGCKDTYTKYNYDHPMVIGMYSFFKSDIVDPEIVKNTLFKILDCWSFEDTWGWDFPMLAMVANRLGKKELAIELL